MTEIKSIEDIFILAGFPDDICVEAAKFCRETGVDPYAIRALLLACESKEEFDYD